MTYNPWTQSYEEPEAAPPPTTAPATSDVDAALADVYGGATPSPQTGSQTIAQATPEEEALKRPEPGLVGQAIKEVGSALSYPIHSPMGFLEGLNDQVKGVFVDPFVQAAKDPSNIPAQLDPRNLERETPGFSLVPGYATSFDVQTPEGREHLKEHPSQVALDVLGLFGGGNKPGQRLPGVMDKASQATAKTGEVLAKTAPGRSVVAGVSGATSKLREAIPTARTGEVAQLPAGQRIAAQEVSRNIGSLLDEFKKADLSPEETVALRESFDRGVPPADPRLVPLYERVKTYSEVDKKRKLEREIPDEVKQVLVDQVEAGLGPKMAQTGLGPDRTRAMFQALRQGMDNPVPEAGKAWKAMNLEVSRRIVSRQRDAKLFEFDPSFDPPTPAIVDRYENVLRGSSKVDEALQLADESYDHVYHTTSEANLSGIRERGLEPPEGGEVYIADSPRNLTYSAPHRNPDQVVLRIKSDSLKNVDHGTYPGEGFTSERIDPSNIEYLDAEGRWNPLSARPVSVAPQVYPWKDYSVLRQAKRRLEKKLKVLDPELHPAAIEGYQAVVDKITPGKYEPMLQAQKAEFALIENRRRFEPGFGRQSYDQMTAEGMTTWRELAEQGVDPVYVPREALKTLTDEVQTPRPQVTTKKPGSLKKTTGRADFYETDPALMITKNEYELANQTVVSKVIADVYQKTGGKPYARALDDYMAQGFSQPQAERMIRANYRGFKLDGTTTDPNPGQLLIRRDVAKGMKHYVEKTMPTLAEELFGMWMVPTLWLAPMFHVNNIVGGVHMVGLKSPGSLLDYLAYGKEAFDTVREGRMDPRVPFGAGMAPQFTKRFTRDSRIAEGGRLAQLWQKIPDKLRLVDKSRKFNEFMDSLNRTIVYLSEHDAAIRKGIDPMTARETAGAAAANLMQNWDSMSVLERQIIQRVYPFWGFRKAMLRTIMTYPMDHPLRMQFLAGLQRDVEERSNLPEEWDNLVGIGGEDENGKRHWISIKGQDAFADVHDFFTMRGFLQNLHPLARPVPEIFGVDTFRGGVPYFDWGAAEIDPNTGRLRRPYKTDVFWNLIPQVSAFARYAGLKNIPPPEDPAPEGWLRWLDEYGSQLRITPGISYKSMQEAEEQFRKDLKTAARMKARAEEREAEKQQKQNPPVKAAPATPAPTPASYDPWAGAYR